ncbi:MAG: methyltransferase [Candidatus Wallbacteria bacterium]|nr:methyltransferase [Candidatus Wallbacteria bacterium]
MSRRRTRSGPLSAGEATGDGEEELEGWDSLEEYLASEAARTSGAGQSPAPTADLRGPKAASTRHYFSRAESQPAETFTFPLRFGDRTIDWVSAHGVFSKQQLDFGSRLLLEVAEIPATGRLLDLGCGTGALGLLALASRVESGGSGEDRLWACLSDISDHALACASANRERLGLTGSAGIVQGEFLAPFRSGVFGTVLFNPPIRAGKAPILETLTRMRRVLEPDGTLWVVARVQQGAKSLLAHLENVFEGAAQVRARRKGYLILRAGGRKADGI